MFDKYGQYFHRKIMKNINYDEFILKYLPSTALEANDDSELSIKSKIKYLTRCQNVIKYLANLFIHLLMLFFVIHL